jgi:membrane protease YdiL (CAAX protease family)
MMQKGTLWLAAKSGLRALARSTSKKTRPRRPYSDGVKVTMDKHACPINIPVQSGAVILTAPLLAYAGATAWTRPVMLRSFGQAKLVEQLAAVLRQSPGARGIVYFGGAMLLLEGARTSVDFTQPDAIPRLHLTLFPLAFGWTYLMERLEEHQQAPLPIGERFNRMALGAGLGAASWLLVLSILRTKGWLTYPEWGWNVTSVRNVMSAMLRLGLGHAAIAWNEETLFRGYGFETLCKAIGPAGASALLIPLFAVYHGTRPQILAGMSVGGALFTVLRFLTDDVSFGLGYHWAWNVMQSAVFGSTDGLPSMRPVHIDGPHKWVGRPGYAEPGGVAILVTLATTMLAAAAWGLRKHKKT